ncbi:MAG TPA: SRPBCC family protein [Ktedonobacterales bacterium]
MAVSVCPIATVAAPADAVWAVLTAPEAYGEWWQARTERVKPPGAAAPGQRVTASVRRLGMHLPVTVDVLARDAAARALDLRTALPFGLVVRNHVVVAPLDTRSSRLTFG